MFPGWNGVSNRKYLILKKKKRAGQKKKRHKQSSLCFQMPGLILKNNGDQIRKLEILNSGRIIKHTNDIQQKKKPTLEQSKFAFQYNEDHRIIIRKLLDKVPYQRFLKCYGTERKALLETESHLKKKMQRAELMIAFQNGEGSAVMSSKGWSWN